MPAPSLRHLLTLCGRAVRRRCPRCGAAGVWQSWTKLRPGCASCGLQLDRGESDHFYGAYMFNFVAAELAVAIAFVVALVVTWPTPPWDAITWGAAAIAVVAPFVFYPFTKALWLAVDLAFRPEDPKTGR